MEKIILGLLMMRQTTVYEIKSYIGANLQSMCSDSMGSIHTAIKKLLALQFIDYEEKVEKSINKKIYFITESGIEQFGKWIEQPMIVGKTKNMELSKLFFMGVVSNEKQIELIEQHLSSLKKERDYLESIKMTYNTITLDDCEPPASQKSYFENNISKYTKKTNKEVITDIFNFQFYTLEYGIKIHEFEIEFYEQIKNRIMEKENYINE